MDWDHVHNLLEVIHKTLPKDFPEFRYIHDQAMAALHDHAAEATEHEKEHEHVA